MQIFVNSVERLNSPVYSASPSRATLVSFFFFYLPLFVSQELLHSDDDIACRILIQNEQLTQVNTFPYLGSLTTEDGECTTEFRIRLEGRQ